MPDSASTTMQKTNTLTDRTARIARTNDQSQTRGASKGTTNNKPKIRAFHNKVRTGCKTCKIRHVRCDEGKPSCKRCVSTGRKCDGYGALVMQPQFSAPAMEPPNSLTHLNARIDVRLLGTRRPADEVRSFSFFMEVAAPSLAGVLQTNFWLKEIPRVCLADQAVWHAVVSLGSSHENYFLRKPFNPNANSFAIRHFNNAIACLLRSGSSSDLWKALTLSLIFTCICILDGQLDQSRLHFKSGCKLLQALETAVVESNIPFDSPRDASGSGQSGLRNPPISIASMRSMLVGFQFLETKLDRMKISTPPSLLSVNDKYSCWRSYKRPQASASGRYLSDKNLSDTVLAAESLMYTFAIESLAQAKHLKEVYDEKGWSGFPVDGPSQKEHQRILKEIDKTVGLFESELEASPDTAVRPVELLELRKAYLSLCVLQSTNRLLLTEDPHEPDPEKRIAALPTLCTKIVGMAEDFFALESTVGCLRIGGPICTPTIVNPLIAVVKWGFGRENRQRARRLLNLPRLEGLWDFRMVAKMTDAMMEREERATIEYSQQRDLDGVYIPDPTARGWKPEDKDERAIHPLARICNTSMEHITARKIRFTVRTWKSWLDGHPGNDTIITW